MSNLPIVASMNHQKIELISSFVDYIALYHRYSVVGQENLPKSGGFLLVCNHSLATYDLMLLNQWIYKTTGRIPRSLMDRWFFKIPKLAMLMNSIGAVEGTQKAAEKLLESGNIVCVAPGGMRESIRSSAEKYKIMWRDRKGFVKLAIATQTPIVLAACPAADDIFDVLPTTSISNFFYKHFKLPVVIPKGLGFTMLPKPIKLRHFIGKPIHPPKCEPHSEVSKETIQEFHQKVCREMRALMGQALTYED